MMIIRQSVCCLLVLVLSSVCLLAHPRDRASASGALLYSPTWQLGPIYYARNATTKEILAAEELAATLARITQTEWTVSPEPEGVLPRGIFVGNTITAAANGALVLPPNYAPSATAREHIEQSQRYRIKIEPTRIFLTGSTPQATLTAVYYFLQNDVSVRWFIPGELGEELPNAKRLRLPNKDELRTASYYNRVMWRGISTQDDRVWDSRNYLTPGWSFNHALHQIVTPDLFESKPHWFSLIKGKRTPTSGGRGPNPNIAEPELAQFVAEQAIVYFEEKPARPTFSISMTDNINFDESPATLSIVTPYRYYRNHPDYSDLVFGFANRVADAIWPRTTEGLDLTETPEVAKEKYLASLAYSWSENVPAFEVHPRVIPYLASDRSQWFDDEFRREDQALIRAWCEAGPEIVGTWDYYEGWPYVIPRSTTGIVADSLTFMHEAGVRAFFSEGGAHWGFDAPRFWLATQLLFNVDQSPDALLDEFYTRYFKEAAEPMRAFYALCEQQWMDQEGPPLWLKHFGMISQAELYPMTVWKQLDGILAEAESAAINPRVKERIALVRKDWEMAQASCALYFAWKESAFSEVHSPEFLSALQQFQSMELSEKYEVWLESVLEKMEPFPGELPESASIRFEEGFEKPLFFGDEYLCGPLHFRGAAFRDNWRTSSFPNNTFTFQRGQEYAYDGQWGIRLEGASFFTLYRIIEATPGSTADARFSFRGKVSPGSRVSLSLLILDSDGQMMAEENSVEVPVGEYDDWQILAKRTDVPVDASWLYVRILVQEQMPGDYLEIDSFQLSEWIQAKE